MGQLVVCFSVSIRIESEASPLANGHYFEGNCRADSFKNTISETLFFWSEPLVRSSAYPFSLQCMVGADKRGMLQEEVVEEVMCCFFEHEGPNPGYNTPSIHAVAPSDLERPLRRYIEQPAAVREDESLAEFGPLFDL